MCRRSALVAAQCLSVVGACTLVCLPPPISYAQDFPAKPVRIVTSDVGGGADVQARIIAQGITLALGQQVIVENRGGGFAPGETVSRAAPDGYTILYTGSTHWLLPFLRRNVPFDPVADFVPIRTGAQPSRRSSLIAGAKRARAHRSREGEAT